MGQVVASRGVTPQLGDPPSTSERPISIAGLIVSVAALAGTIYNDLRTKTPEPSPAIISRTIRVQLSDVGGLDSAQRDRIIGIVIDETVQTAQRSICYQG